MNGNGKSISFALCEPGTRLDISSSVAECMGRLLSVRTETAPPLRLPSEAFNHRRGQYHAGIILNFLADQYPDHLRVIGITPHDLFLPIFTHVYGEAQMPGRAAIVSLFRLEAFDAPNVETLLSRIMKITAHELLHTFEVTHCHHSECIMRPITGLGQLDPLPLKLCRSCQNLWEDTRNRLDL